MKKKVNFKVNKRDLLGKKVKLLRKTGFVVANLLQPGEDSIAIKADLKEFNRLYKELGETNVIYLNIDDEKTEVPVLIDEVVFTPLSGGIDHVVFKKVNLTEKVETEVPVELTGEFDVQGSTYLLVKDAVLISALPTNIPEHFIIDLSEFTEAGQGVTLADLKLPEGVELVLSEDESPEETQILIVQEEKEEEPEEEAEPEESTEAVEGAEEAPAAEEKPEEKPTEESK